MAVANSSACPIFMRPDMHDTTTGNHAINLDAIGATLPANLSTNPEQTGQECCLVQIYPADVVDGMVLLDDNKLLIGRDPAAGLCLPNGSVSRHHVEISLASNGNYVLQDLQSTNGTLVNGQRIATAELESGDTVKIGTYLFKFLAAGSVESQYHETVYTAMTQDALTGAMNKRYLLEALSRELARSRRQSSELAVVMMDIDHFKCVNDTHGHLVGDEVLREFGRRLHQLCREDDLFARYGGEEFCLCVFGATRSDVEDITNRCLDVIRSTPFQSAAGQLAITASFGVALHSEFADADTLGLINQADKRLYQAKECGRDRVCF